MRVEKLNTNMAIKLSAPGFNGLDPKYGGVTTYPPEPRKRGISCTPTPGYDAERCSGMATGFESYAQINPAARNDMIEVYECEPYAYAQNILGDNIPSSD